MVLIHDIYNLFNKDISYSCDSLYFYKKEEKKSKNYKFLCSCLGITTGVIITTGIIKLFSNDFSINLLKIKPFIIIGK